MTLGALLVTVSSANTSILVLARTNFAIDRDRVVTNWFSGVHPDYTTPYQSTLVIGVVIVLFIAALGQDIEVLAKATSILHLAAYVLTNVTLIVFRETDSEYDPTFIIPLYPVTPFVSMALSLGLLIFVDGEELLPPGLFVVDAAVRHFMYARNSADRRKLPGRHILSRGDELPDTVVDIVTTVAPNGSGRIGDAPATVTMVAVSNPRTERTLVMFVVALARFGDGWVLATRVTQVSDQTSLAVADD